MDKNIPKTKKTLLLPVISILICFSCEPVEKDKLEILSPGLHEKTFTTDSHERQYTLYAPSFGVKSDQTYPVVFLVHGHGSSKDVLSGKNNTKSAFHEWKAIADANSVVLCYPEGTTGSDDLTGWNDCRGDATKLPKLDDSKFLSELIDHLIDSVQAAENRIYFCGVSNGGFMTMRMGIEHHDKIAAIAIINAQMATNSACGQPTSPLSILLMNGTLDKQVPYDGGYIGSGSGYTLSTDSTLNLWISNNNTESTPQTLDFPDIETNDKSIVTKALYANGTNGTEVCLYKITGGGHTEPSINFQYSTFYELLVGPQNHDIEMANEVWDFLSTKVK